MSYNIMKTVLISWTDYPQGSANYTLRSPVPEHNNCWRLCKNWFKHLPLCEPRIVILISSCVRIFPGFLGRFPLKFSKHTSFEYNLLFDNRVLTLCPHFWIKLLSLIHKPFISTLPRKSTLYDSSVVLWPHPSKEEWTHNGNSISIGWQLCYIF